MRQQLSRLSERGDTIVEVMVALAVLGLTLAVSYATANRSLQNTRQSQENSIASTLVQSQLEALRGNASDTRIYTNNTPFCFSSGAYTTNLAQCMVNNRYKLSITYPAGGDSQAFQVSAQWDDVVGQGTDTVTMYYHLHAPVASAPTGNTPTTCSSTAGDTYARDHSVLYVATDDSGQYPYYTSANQQVPGGYHGPTIVATSDTGSTITVQSPVICAGVSSPLTQQQLAGKTCTVNLTQQSSPYGNSAITSEYLGSSATSGQASGVINSQYRCADSANPEAPGATDIHIRVGWGHRVFLIGSAVYIGFDQSPYLACIGGAIGCYGNVTVNGSTSLQSSPSSVQGFPASRYFVNYLKVCPASFPNCK